jgi:hypothetical protein
MNNGLILGGNCIIYGIHLQYGDRLALEYACHFGTINRGMPR